MSTPRTAEPSGEPVGIASLRLERDAIVLAGVHDRRDHPGRPVCLPLWAAAFVVSLGASLVAMVVVGVAVSLLTGRNPLFSGLRQVLPGGAAARVTFLVGRLIGVSVP